MATKKNDNCCGKTVTETNTKVTEYGSNACKMPQGTLQYIGARYVPVFADPVEWTADRPYEHLMMVQNEGNTYISKQAVPVGIELPTITGENEYWILFSNYNAQIEEYRQEVARLSDDVSTVSESVGTLENETLPEMKNDLWGNYYIPDDFENYVTLPEVSGGAINSMAFDETDGALYACYRTGNTSLIKRFPRFANYSPGETPASNAELAIDNSHCNSATIANGKLYLSDWNKSKISVVNLGTFTEEEPIDVGFVIRAAGFADGIALIQPYYANYFYRLYTNPNKTANNEILHYAIGIKTLLNPQSEYVQDLHIKNGAIFRVCSDGTRANTRPYIECYASQLAASPIIIPLTLYPNEEYEGITIGAGYMYVCTVDGKIQRSAKLSTYQPQVAGAITSPSLYWQSSDSQFCFINPEANTGLNFETVYSTDTYAYRIPIPTAIYNACDNANGEAPRLVMACDRYGLTGTANAAGFEISIPLKKLRRGGAVQFSTMLNATSGLRFFGITAYWRTTEDLGRHVLVRINAIKDIAADGTITQQQVTEDGFVFSNLSFTIER